MHLTSGYELTTAITNIILFIVSLTCFFMTKKNNKLFRLFFILISIDSFLGTIAHGIVMSESINNLLWIILIFFFTLSINVFLNIFIKLKLKLILLLSELLTILLCTQMLYGLNFLLTFTIYVIIVLIVSTYYVLKRPNKLYYILSFIVLLIGGVLLLCRCNISVLNYNGICHLFLAVSLILLLLASKKEIKK